VELCQLGVCSDSYMLYVLQPPAVLCVGSDGAAERVSYT